MFIIFDKVTKKILSLGEGTPIVSGNKLMLGTEPVCNDLTLCGWKYIESQRLEINSETTEFLRDADYYGEITPPRSIAERMADVEQYLVEMALGV